MPATVSATGNPWSGEGAELPLGAGVPHAATGDDQRSFRLTDDLGAHGHLGRVRSGPPDPVTRSAKKRTG